MKKTQEIIERYYQCLQDRDRSGLLELLLPDIKIIYHANNSSLPWAGEFNGIDGFDEFLSRIKSHLDIVQVTITDRIFSDTKVVMQCQGVWKRKCNAALIEGAMVNVFTIEEGLISKYEVYADTAAFEKGMRRDD